MAGDKENSGGRIMAKYEEKFIVINTKFIKQIDNVKENNVDQNPFFPEHPACVELRKALRDYANACKDFLRVDISRKKYYVCNQDEPYAQQVIDIILNGEDEKARQIE